MSRLVNANYLRLGSISKWASSWTAEDRRYKIYLKEDFLISRFIKHLCNTYGVPLFTYTHRRWTFNEGIRLEPKTQKEVITNNSFRLDHIGLIFSHLRIHRKGSIMQIDIYFVDSKLETRRLSTSWGNKSISYIIFQGDRVRYHPSAQYLTFKRLVAPYLQSLKRKSTKSEKYDEKSLFLSWEVSDYSHLESKLIKLMYFVVENQLHGSLIDFDIENFNLHKFFLLLWNKKISISKRHFLVFFLRLFLEKVLTIVAAMDLRWAAASLPRNFLKPSYGNTKDLVAASHTFKMEHLVKMYMFFLFLEYEYKAVIMHFFQDIYENRLLLFRVANLGIHNTLKMLKNTVSTVCFYGMHIKNVSANFLCNFIIIRLGQYWGINQIMPPIIRNLTTSSHVRGYKFVIAGRLTRKERAAYLVYSSGLISLNTLSVKLNYSADFRVMRFGVVGVKVWLRHYKQRPFYYYFKYYNEHKSF